MESALLGLAGGAAGLALAAALHRALPWLLPADFPRIADVAVDARVMGFAVAVTTLAGVACALLPALHARRVNLIESLSDCGSAPVGGGARSPAARARTLIMAGQIAIACVLMTNLAKPRLYAVVLAGFSVFALAIAGVGLFGVLSYSVAQRSREIGVRTALGAQPADIVRLVLRQVAAILAGGVAAGLWLAFAASNSLTTVLHGVSPHDLASFVVVPVVLGIVTGVACVVPARRAARVDPLIVLRSG